MQIEKIKGSAPDRFSFFLFLLSIFCARKIRVCTVFSLRGFLSEICSKTPQNDSPKSRKKQKSEKRKIARKDNGQKNKQFAKKFR